MEIQLMALPPSQWPRHLFDAWRILTTELLAPHDQARAIVLNAISAAQDCVKAQTRELNQAELFRIRIAIRDACRRIANCIKRAPAAIRRRLDEAITPLIREAVLDLEVMEEILGMTIKVIRRCPERKLARTVLRAMGQIRKAHCEALDFGSRSRLHTALVEFAATSAAEHSARAADVFAVAASALSADKKQEKNKHVQILITRYVADLAEIWRRAGLKPSRAISYLNEAYRSKFHQFAELILTAMAAPWSLKHELRKSPNDRDPWKSLQRADHQWLVSDNHVRKALR